MTVTRQDPFTIEIIKEALNAIGDEMFVSLQRTSMSPIIYEVLDYCCGITDHRGQLLAQGNGVAGFLGTLTFAVQSVIEKFGIESLAEGDIYVTNDPARLLASLPTRPTGRKSAAKTRDRGRRTPSTSGKKDSSFRASSSSIEESRSRACSI
jgi:hypothetical protein